MFIMHSRDIKISLLAFLMLTLFYTILEGQSELIWSQNFGGEQDDTFQDITLTEDGQAILIGYSQSNQGLILNNKGLYDLIVSQISTTCLLYTSPSPRDRTRSRMPSSA